MLRVTEGQAAEIKKATRLVTTQTGSIAAPVVPTGIAWRPLTRWFASTSPREVELRNVTTALEPRSRVTVRLSTGIPNTRDLRRGGGCRSSFGSARVA